MANVSRQEKGPKCRSLPLNAKGLAALLLPWCIFHCTRKVDCIAASLLLSNSWKIVLPNLKMKELLTRVTVRN